nr:hypothetical protein [Faecalibaculum rodentium]
MDISTLTPDKQVKLQYWLDVIRQCRASGLTNQVWCEQHDISLKSYYYWIAKIRKMALEELRIFEPPAAKASSKACCVCLAPAAIPQLPKPIFTLIAIIPPPLPAALSAHRALNQPSNCRKPRR